MRDIWRKPTIQLLFRTVIPNVRQISRCSPLFTRVTLNEILLAGAYNIGQKRKKKILVRFVNLNFFMSTGDDSWQ